RVLRDLRGFIRAHRAIRCAFFFQVRLKPDPTDNPRRMLITIEEFARRLRAGEVTALEITNACLGRIDELQPSLNAFIRVMADEAMRDAETADRELAAGRDRGPLHGVPIAVKDIIDARGIPTTAAPRVATGDLAAPERA